MDATAPDLLIVGTIHKPHGIRGELAVRTTTDQPEFVFRPGRVFSVGDVAGRPTGQVLTLDRARPFKEGMLVKLSGFTSRTPELDALRGATLLLPRAETSPLAEDEAFYDELLGMQVRTVDAEVGEVAELYETPNGLLLGVRGPAGREHLVPFVREFVVRLDREARLLEIRAPAGLLEL